MNSSCFSDGDSACFSFLPTFLDFVNVFTDRKKKRMWKNIKTFFFSIQYIFPLENK